MPRRKAKAEKKAEEIVQDKSRVLVRVPKRILLLERSDMVIFPGEKELMLFRVRKEYPLERARIDGFVALVTRLPEEEYPPVATILAILKVSEDEGGGWITGKPVDRTLISDIRPCGSGNDVHDCVCGRVPPPNITREEWEGSELRECFAIMQAAFFKLFQAMEVYRRIFQEALAEKMEEAAQDPAIQDKLEALAGLYDRLSGAAGFLEEADETTAYAMINAVGNFLSELVFFLLRDEILSEESGSMYFKSLREVLIGNDIAFALNHFAKILQSLDEKIWRSCCMGTGAAGSGGAETGDESLPEEVRKIIEEESQFAKRDSAEGAAFRRHISWLRKVPWNKRREEEQDFGNVAASLENDHYGFEKINEKILRTLAIRKVSPRAKGSIVCLVGPAGAGKTSLAESIARALKRDFVRISLGGMHDESSLKGHGFTYIGSLPGQIIQGACKAGSKNFVLFLDEVDKMTRHGESNPVNVLEEILDPDQNVHFHDNYLSVDFDLSEALIILAANTTATIPEPVLDRAEVIYLSGYTDDEKTAIAKEYIFPDLLEEVLASDENLKSKNLPLVKIEIDDEAMFLGVSRYTGDSGMRSTKRFLKDDVIGRVCKKIVEGKGEEIFEPLNNSLVPEDGSSITRIVHVTTENLKDYLGDPPPPVDYLPDVGNPAPRTCLVPVFFKSGHGGNLYIEVKLRRQKEFKVKATGHLQDVLKESMSVAFSRMILEGGLFEDLPVELFVHVHLPDGHIDKDGTSAGIGGYVALYGSLAYFLSGERIAVKPYFTVTGEIALAREVALRVGGHSEKIVGSMRNGVREFVMPFADLNELKELRPGIRKKITRIVTPEDLIREKTTWRALSLTEKPEGSFTIYCIEKPEDAVEIGFPLHFPPKPEWTERWLEKNREKRKRWWKS